MFVSTRGQAPPVRLAEALRLGLAPDGGLYVPEAIPAMTAGEWADLRGRTAARGGDGAHRAAGRRHLRSRPARAG